MRRAQAEGHGLLRAAPVDRGELVGSGCKSWEGACLFPQGLAFVIAPKPRPADVPQPPEALTSMLYGPTAGYSRVRRYSGAQ